MITAQFQEEVEKLGLFYPPDPASIKVSSIGGNVAHCAGGLRAVKYGVTRDYVLGLTIVLPTGEILKTGVETAPTMGWLRHTIWAKVAVTNRGERGGFISS